MMTRGTHASTTSKVTRITTALGTAWERARVADRQVMEIRTDVSRYASWGAPVQAPRYRH